MLLVIVGAGASFDSMSKMPLGTAPSYIETVRPPLANQLFENREIFSQRLRAFPECHGLVPILREANENQSLESVLQRIQEQVETHPYRAIQLASVKYYLHDML